MSDLAEGLKVLAELGFFNPSYYIQLGDIPYKHKRGCVIPLTYGRARICVGPDDYSIEEHW